METVIREVHTWNLFVERAVEGISKEGGKGARYFGNADICDGIAQGHDGINYSWLPKILLT